MTNASTPQVSARGTPIIRSATTSMTATIRPKIVVTTQYLRTLWAKSMSALAMLGRYRRSRSMRSPMPAASKVMNTTMASSSTSSESPLVIVLSTCDATPAKLDRLNPAMALRRSVVSTPYLLSWSRAELKRSVNSSAYPGKVSTSTVSVQTADPRTRMSSP